MDPDQLVWKYAAATMRRASEAIKLAERGELSRAKQMARLAMKTHEKAIEVDKLSSSDNSDIGMMVYSRLVLMNRVIRSRE